MLRLGSDFQPAAEAVKGAGPQPDDQETGEAPRPRALERVNTLQRTEITNTAGAQLSFYGR